MPLNSTVERTFDAVLRRSPVQPLFRWRTSRRLIVLAYHDVADDEMFAWQVAHLRQRMHPVSVNEMIRAMASGQALPRNAVLITFDDGDRTVFERARPILADNGVPAVAFVVAGLLDTETPFWWREVDELLRRGGSIPGLPTETGACVRALKRVTDQQRRIRIDQLRRTVGGPSPTVPQLRREEVAALDAAGIAIGNHTLTHPCLDRCGSETLVTEIHRAHEILTGILGTAPTSFAYPNGNRDDRAARLFRELGYEAGFLFDHRIAPFPPRDPFAISRVRVSATTHRDRFRILLSGLHASVHHLIGRS